MNNEIYLTSIIGQARGVIGRYPAPEEQFIFEFDIVRQRSIHMIGVRQPLLVQWFIGDHLQHEELLQPWIGFGRARCDRIIERRPRE